METRAYTYREGGIRVVFWKEYLNRGIVEHELRRVKQILEGDCSELRAYWEGVRDFV